MTSPSPFARPVLNVVIADDEPDYQSSLEALILGPIREWAVLKTGQFELIVHRVDNLEDFQQVAGGRLDAGELVYAVLDLIFPEKPGFDRITGPDTRYGKRMLGWCLDATEYDERAAQSFQFCVVSGEQKFLSGVVERDSPEDRKLHDRVRHRGVRMVNKRELIRPDLNKANTAMFYADIRGFVLRHLRYATFPAPSGGDARQSIWFDPRQVPSGLLAKADAEAARTEGGLYLIFANTAGYEEDWFRLFCHLRGVKAHIRNFRKLSPDDDLMQDWTGVFTQPSGAIYVSHLDQAASSGLDAEQLIVKSDLLKKAVRGECVVFVRFPYFATPLDYETYRQNNDTGAEESEVAILSECLRLVYGTDVPPAGHGFFAEEHARVLAFPDYDCVLKREGVLRRTIEYEAHQRQQTLGPGPVPLDPEFAEFLAEYPWVVDRKELTELHNVIRMAYDEFRRKHPTTPRPAYVTEKYLLPSLAARTEFNKELGFAVRTRWLFRHLSTSGPHDRVEGVDGAGRTGLHALRALEAIHDLFVRLTGWRELLDKLHPGYDEPSAGPAVGRAGPAVPPEAKYLTRVLDFLVKVFESPGDLGAEVDEFRTSARSDKWKRTFPGRARKEAQLMELFVGIRMVWPLEKLPLHWAITEYLHDSDIDYRVVTDYKNVLEMNFDLQKQFDELASQWDVLLKQLSKRENQRRTAIKAMHRLHAPPVATFLQQDERASSPTDLNGILIALLHYPAFLAVCEDFYRFGGKYCNPAEVRELLKAPKFGVAVSVIVNYVGSLQKDKVFEDSVLRLWHKSWANENGQALAVRIAKNIAGELKEKFPDRFGTDDQGAGAINEIARKGADGQHFPIELFLRFVSHLRVAVAKIPTETDNAIWQAVGPETLNLIRQFVSAAAGDVRLGAVDGDRVRLWQTTHVLTDPLTFAPPAPGAVVPAAGEVWALRPDAAGLPRPLFRVDELIRLRPADAAVYGYYNADEWRPLSYSPPADAIAPSDRQPWLPPAEKWKTFPLIRAYLGK